MKMNKKTLIIVAVAVVVVLAVVLALVLAGGNKAPENTEKDYSLGMGVVVNFDQAKAQINATVATVVLDAEGKIVSCRIDVAQNTVSIKNGAVDTTKVYETKMELGTRYGMGQTEITEANKWMDNNGDNKVLEWDVQTKEFEKYVVGMTGTQVAALASNLQTVNGHLISKDEALLSAGCTIQITDFIGAVAKACNDEQKSTFKTDKTFTLGVAANSFDDGSKDGTVKVYTDFAASVVVDGKIVASLNDAIQPTMTYANDVVTATSYKGTKRELKGDYGMGQTEITEANKWMDNDGNKKVLEWFEQSAAFSAHVVGMTAAQVKDMGTTLVNGHYISTDKALLDAGCSIQITAIKAVVAESVTNAR